MPIPSLALFLPVLVTATTLPDLNGLPSHPYLYLNAAQCDALRAAAPQLPLRPYYEQLLQLCDELLDQPPVPVPEHPSTPDDRSPGEIGRARQVQGRVVSLALAYRLTNRR